MEQWLLFIGIFVRFFIGMILLSTGCSKLLHPLRFQQAIQDYRLFSPALDRRFHLSTFAAFLLFPLELLAGGCLFCGQFLLQAILISILLFVSFSWALLLNLWRGRRELLCHCAGVLGDQAVSWWQVLRNAGLLLCILFLLLTLPQAAQPNLLLGSVWISHSLMNDLLPLFLLATLAILTIILLQNVRSHWQLLSVE
ncbi:MauE/DoxX family redox-associated membrane protein [Tengunoibacter tsumagoiensis]|uniref:MauE/DoxX family redox-associated membrane protein n=1 Tax=Tengunoibacter tsumagoiensis TaxID=2014871 RepID=UPI00138730BF|nr:MauE/DoxX family redox-associated membrane protein [Tengunoibacter tsumagoiensis]